MQKDTPPPIPLLDLRAQHAAIRDEVMAEITRVIDAQTFILGPEVVRLEEQTQQYCSTPYAVGCASGSDALYLALLALGIGHGDEVLTTPYTFFATAGAVTRAGARPVFCDIEPGTFNLDVSRVEAALDAHPAVKAVIPVHLYGAPAAMDELNEIAARRGVAVIEDAAQSIGAEYKGRRCGGLARVACFSFFPTKNLGAYGDGGMLTTSDAGLAHQLRALRVHGSHQRYYHEWVGINSRLDALQAAVLNVKFRHLDSWTAGRQHNASLYRRYFSELDVPVIPPEVAAGTTRHVYNQFVIRCQKRDALRSWLSERGIGTEVYYPLPLHLQECFSGLGYAPGDFPESERAAKESLALPIFPELAEESLLRIVQTIGAFYRQV
ncbi:MAG: DegT/DnrJ/EryC1/StrS family aminotransferase [Acidobacteria bacterium]|nr:DegT/DnrJ/EryC1/StrS family aminotransferase [Acidobacteriota bacterium]